MANEKQPVGYKRPPVHSRFKPGQSGNPKGSSKKARSTKGMLSVSEFASMALDELRKPISYLHNGKRVTTTRYQAIVARCASDALAGKAGAQRLSVEIAARASEADVAHHRDQIRSYAELQRMQEAEWARQVKQGVVEPQVFPHPDDIWFDDQSGMPVCDGAWDAETDEQFKRVREVRDRLRKLLEGLKDRPDTSDEALRSLRDSIATLDSRLPRRLKIKS